MNWIKKIMAGRYGSDQFLKLISPVYWLLHKIIRRFRDAKTHKYYNCPNCKQTLRLPKGKGKISISCPKCRTEFIRKT